MWSRGIGVVAVSILLPLCCAAADLPSCVILPTKWPDKLASSLPFRDGDELARMITARLRSANFCVPLELNRDSEPPRNALYVLSAISRADRFQIKGPEYSGGQIVQENFDVTAELRFADVRTGEAFYSRAITAESIFKGVQPDSAQVSNLFSSAAIKAMTTVVDTTIREYRPGVIEGHIVRTVNGKIFVDRGKQHGLGMGRLEVVDENDGTAGIVQIEFVLDSYSIGKVVSGSAPLRAKVRTSGANLAIKSGPRYAAVVAPLPSEILSRGISDVDIADWSQTTLGRLDSLALLAPVLSTSFFDQQAYIIRRSGGLNRDVLNQREAPDAFAVVSIRDVSTGTIDLGVSARRLYRVGVFLQLIDALTNEVQFSTFQYESSDQVIKEKIRDIGEDSSIFRDLLQAALRKIAAQVQAGGGIQNQRATVIRGEEGSTAVRFQDNAGCRTGKRYMVYTDHHDEPAYPLLERSAVVIVEGGSPDACKVRVLAGKNPSQDDQLFNDGFVSTNLGRATIYAVDADAATRPYAYPAVSTYGAADPEINIWGLLDPTVFPKPEIEPVSQNICNLRFTIVFDPPTQQQNATAIRGVATIVPACSTASKTLPYTMSVRAGNATIPIDYYRREVAQILVFELVKQFMVRP